MNVTFVTSGLYTGGAEFAMLRMCRAFVRAGARPSVVSLLDDGDIGRLLRDDGVPVLALGMRSPLGWATAHRAFMRWCAARQPQLVQGWMYHGNLAALYLTKRGIPVAWGIRQSLQGNRDGLSTRLAIRASAALARRAASVIYNSAIARIQHEAIGFAPVHGTVIPNGFDLAEFRHDIRARDRLRSELGLKPEDLVVGHVARFHPSKDHAALLRAIARVARTHPTVRAVLAGDGVGAANGPLASLANELGIRDRIVLLDRSTNIASLMSAFDLYCSTSSGMEGFSNVVAEAMCCEVPCVATEVGDAQAIVGGCGRIVPPNNGDALSATLEEMLAMSPTTRRDLGLAARRRIAEHFSIDAVATRYLRLYESLIIAQQTATCAA